MENENIGIGIEKANLEQQINRLLNNRVTFDMNNDIIENFNIEKLTGELWKYISSSEQSKR